MVQLICDCKDRHGIGVNSYKLYEQLKYFFDKQVKKGIFRDVPVTEPFYVGYSEIEDKEIKWYATKWYKCNSCGCLWEFDYPDFPAKGFVRKFDDGNHHTSNVH